MGWFSTKRKHYVDTSVVRVIEDEQVPDSTKVALVESIFAEDTTIIEAIKNQQKTINELNKRLTDLENN